jgi:hypothetical protein
MLWCGQNQPHPTPEKEFTMKYDSLYLYYMITALIIHVSIIIVFVFLLIKKRLTEKIFSMVFAIYSTITSSLPLINIFIEDDVKRLINLSVIFLLLIFIFISSYLVARMVFKIFFPIIYKFLDELDKLFSSRKKKD